VLFILTFDEGNKNPKDPKFFENKVYTAFYGPMIKPGVIKTHYDFYDLLRTIEVILKLDSLGRKDHDATTITSSIWRNP
jgi:hypothetical protein